MPISFNFYKLANKHIDSLIGIGGSLLKKLSIYPVCLILFTACTLTDKPLVNDKFVQVNGEQFKRDDSGNVIVSKEQLEVLKGTKDIIVMDAVLPSGGVAVTEEELHLLSKDKQLFAETMNNEIIDNEVYSFLIKKGSLKDNLERLSTKYSTQEDPLSLEYGDFDYYVDQSKIIRATSIEELIAVTLAAFPVFASVDGATFFMKKGSLKQNLNRLGAKFSTNEDPISVEYEGGDFYVPTNKLIRGDSLEEVVAIILSSYPVFGSVE